MPTGLAWVASNRQWIPARHLTLINRKLLDVAAGRCKRLMVFMPPRHGKSSLISHYFPAWLLGTFPEQRIILTSYDSEFAVSWSRRVRDTLEEIGQPLFGVETRKDSRAAHRWELTAGGGMYATGVGGPLTGRGSAVAIIDDPIKNAEEATSEVCRKKAWDWFTSTLYTRLEPHGAVVLMQTRWHVEDLAGCLLLDMQDGSGEQWDVINLPAIAEHEGDALGRKIGEALWPERYGLDQLEQIKKTLQARGEGHWFEALYQQRPIHVEALEWPEEYFSYPGFWFEEWPRGEFIDLRVMALDPSKGKDADRSDYSAYVMLARDKNGVLYVEADLKRRPVPQMVADGVEHVRNFHPDGLGIECNVFQELLVTEFIREGQAQQVHLPIYQINNQVNKEVRIRRLGPYLAQRQIRFKANSPGTSILVRQLRDFPAGLHNDGPDSLEMCIRLAVDIWNGRMEQRPGRIIAR